MSWVSPLNRLPACWLLLPSPLHPRPRRFDPARVLDPHWTKAHLCGSAFATPGMRVEAFLVDLEAWLFLAQKLHHYQAQKFLARRAYRLSVFSQRETISSRTSSLAASSLDGAPQRLAEKAHIATAEFCRASA
jgi:hypothetical protein